MKIASLAGKPLKGHQDKAERGSARETPDQCATRFTSATHDTKNDIHVDADSDADAQDIPNSSADPQNYNYHHRIQGFTSLRRITPPNTACLFDETLDSTRSSSSTPLSDFFDAPEQPQHPPNTKPENRVLLSSPHPDSDSVATVHAGPGQAAGCGHDDGASSEPEILRQDVAAVASILTPSTMSAASGPHAPLDSQAALLRALLQINQESHAQSNDLQTAGPQVESRKVWVKRPGGSATLIPIRDDMLVDDLRDHILRKYANSIGRYFDSPDVHLHITPRDKRASRPLRSDEVLSRTLDSFYPGGQTVDEALVILVPQSPPRPSPRSTVPYPGIPHFPAETGLPSESGEGYFPPVIPGAGSLAPPVGVGNDPSSHPSIPIPPGPSPGLPSPGSGRPQVFADRPHLGRSHTSTPATQGNAAALPNLNDSHPPLPAPGTHSLASVAADVAPSTPPARTSSPRPLKKTKPKKPERQLLPVPPISVLLVEDNPVSLKLLEALAKRLKVRSQSAMNGRDAVLKWRTGGFHLVLMDIQLPVMNGLEATREIRRLERENSIGVFTSTAGRAPGEEGNMKEEDRLENIEMFKSPVIIVALTASSLQSDRHEALAAGCNDFITKPVSPPWLETKVREWGCMQALIDFEGWKTWKSFSQDAEDKEAAQKEAAKKAPTVKSKVKKKHSAQVSAAS
ncbi:uncharacterized protein DNG_06425 [Cephalotrichum gorgonifer]|uniref:Response regulatory domain-containing protein n=1 Tax=Cephalotrichum gorgonifer TaxID=2041049 RepID=A0AAE8N028_9PEZI|nr:uncharacterized protein DNG_06425 [Cephalotrichum gorgonifer]